MGTLRAITTSYWTALALGMAALALHVRWYIVDKAAGSEVVSGFGAALLALGVFVGSSPYVRVGIGGLVKTALPPAPGGRPYKDGKLTDLHRDHVAVIRPCLVRDVRAERVVAVAVVVLGTLLNGYGTLIARTFGLRSG